jgi:alpha-mannosidase
LLNAQEFPSMAHRRHCWLYPIVLLAVGIWPLWSTHTHACASQEAGELDQVILVFKTHFDIGYTDLASNVIDHYRTTMIDQALEVCDRNRELPPEQQFVWTLPGWPLSQIAADWSGQTATRKTRIEQAIRAGRFVVHGLPFTTHTELLEPEDLVRGLGFSSAIARAADVDLPRDAKMTDVPCHSWIMPTLLRHAGIDFLHLGCNAASQSPHVPLLFWWEGPDGSRVLTMYVAEGYGTGLLPPDDWPHRTWLALIHTGDNHGPPRPEEVSRLVDELRAERPEARVRIGQLSDFADAILAERPDLPVVRGDMPDTWIHGPMCDPRGASLARTVQSDDRRRRVTQHVAQTLGRAGRRRRADRSRSVRAEPALWRTYVGRRALLGHPL